MSLRVFCFLSIISLFSCSSEKVEEASGSAHLGVISFAPSCSEESAAMFEEGLLLLHSFEYADARKQFVKAREADDRCVMAYWGEAMSYNHPLWSSQYTDDAREALQRLADDRDARMALAQTPIERDFLQAVEILYGDGEKLDRDKNYATHMEKMYRDYPESDEVAAFYALSLLGSTVERDVKTYERGAGVVKNILDENPEHPGALHYLIHAYDDPGHAHLALDAANKYSKVAPDAGHALHMPSHIYVALGMWNEVVRSNIDSWNASEDRKERLELDNDALNYHALQWLMYGLLQQSRNDTARVLVDSMISYTNKLPSPGARAYLTSMRAGFLAETSGWNRDLQSLEIDDEELNVVLRATNSFVDGMGAYARGDLEALEDVIGWMGSARQEEEKKLMQRGAAMCSGVSWATQLPNQQDINNAYVMEMELIALYHDLAGDTDEANTWFLKATELEDSTSYSYGPPVIVSPSHELYGEWLIRQERFMEAVEQFELALEKSPGRRIAEGGLRVAQKNAANVM